MSTFEAQDSLVFGAQLEVQSLLIRADLETLSSDHPSVVSFDVTDVAGTDATITVEVKEDIKKVVKAAVYDNKIQSYLPEVATFSGTSIVFANIDTSASDRSDCVVEVHYAVE